jgi:hypothetical protein
MIDQKEIESVIKESIKNKVEGLVSEADIKLIIARTVDTVVAERIHALISAHVSSIIQKGQLEKNIVGKFDTQIQNQIEQEIKNRTTNAVARIDVASEVGKHIELYLDKRISSASLPTNLISHRAINWDGFKLTADALDNGVIENFSSSGIQDVASEVGLTVTDGAVIVEHSLITRSAEVKELLFANKISVTDIQISGNLIINESINKQFKSMITDNVMQLLSSQKIDVINNPIYANGKEVLTENSLGAGVVNSNLRKLGRLTELNVAGPAQFNETMIVANGRIGINTNEPDGALTVWDDDSELTIKRHKKKNMYIGTMRDADLSLGVNGDVKLAIRRNGEVEVNKLVVNGLKISVSDTVPHDSGSPGEIVIMSNAKEHEPWAYRSINGAWFAIK